MASQHTMDVAKRATTIYDQRLRTELERDHLYQFVAVESDSGDFFLGATLSEAIQAARKAHPDRIIYTLRIGHSTAVNLGAILT